MAEKQKNAGWKGLCLFLALALLMSFHFFSLYSKERDSEYYVNSMISAGRIGKEIPGSFGLTILRSGETVFDGEDGGSLEGSSLYIAYHPEEFGPENVDVELIRLQQLGLQGWLAYGLGSAARLLHLSGRMVYYGFRWLNALLLSATLLGIALELKRAYDELFGLAFLGVSLMSTWMAAFGANLYWMEFTWYLPMLFGLMAMNHPGKRGWFYLLILVSVALKCGCGYEYVTNVMLEPVFFPSAAWLCALKEKNGRAGRLFRILAGTAAASLLGFVCTILLHAYLRVGDIYGGLIDILYCDVLRRTVGDPVVSAGGETVTVSVSVLSVLLRYWVFSVTGLLASGCFLADLVLLIRGRRGRTLFRDAVLLVLGALATSSWFVLAKSHSYVHIHLNGVLFYLPFMPIAVYLLLKQLIGLALRKKELRPEGILGRLRQISLGE